MFKKYKSGIPCWMPINCIPIRSWDSQDHKKKDVLKLDHWTKVFIDLDDDPT